MNNIRYQLNKMNIDDLEWIYYQIYNKEINKNKKQIIKELLNPLYKYKFNSINDRVDILKRYISDIKKKIKCTRKIKKTNQIIKSSKSGQQIYISDKYVYKIPPKVSFKIQIDNNNLNCIEIDNYTMNLLIQNLIKNLKLKNKIEHYKKLCYLNDTYVLVSDKMKYKDFNTLEDYLLKSIKIDIKLVYKWIKQVCDTLDYLYKKMQFHHCDPKAAQIFLNNKGNAIVGDLDKVTFTLNINNQPTRIKVSKTLLISLYTQIPDYLKLTNIAVKMRYECLPRSTNDFEKAGFISSTLLLCRNKKLSKKLLKWCQENNLYDFNKYIIKIPENIENLTHTQLKSLSTPVKYVTEQYKPIFSKLKSSINI